MPQKVIKSHHWLIGEFCFLVAMFKVCFEMFYIDYYPMIPRVLKGIRRDEES